MCVCVTSLCFSGLVAITIADMSGKALVSLLRGALARDVAVWIVPLGIEVVKINGRGKKGPAMEPVVE